MLQVAKKSVKVMVVGNPCNTNALIASRNAPSIPKENFHALTRLDENRAKFQLANKAGVFFTSVDRVAVWGNHSTTQVCALSQFPFPAPPPCVARDKPNHLRNNDKYIKGFRVGLSGWAAVILLIFLVYSPAACKQLEPLRTT